MKHKAEYGLLQLSQTMRKLAKRSKENSENETNKRLSSIHKSISEQYDNIGDAVDVILEELLKDDD